MENRSIKVVGDYFTKWVEAYAILNQEIITATSAPIFGVPMELHIDRSGILSLVFFNCYVSSYYMLCQIPLFLMAYCCSAINETNGVTPAKLVF